jgi:hypothetical protein
VAAVFAGLGIWLGGTITKMWSSGSFSSPRASRVFDKLGARRRTEAVQVGKSWRLIP